MPVPGPVRGHLQDVFAERDPPPTRIAVIGGADCQSRCLDQAEVMKMSDGIKGPMVMTGTGSNDRRNLAQQTSHPWHGPQGLSRGGGFA